MADDDDEGTKEEGEAPKKGKGKLFIIIGVVVLLLVGVGGFLAFSGGSKNPDGEEEVEEVDPEENFRVVTLEPFVVNLADSQHFLKVTIALRYDPALLDPEPVVEEEGEAAGGGGAGGEHIDHNLPDKLLDRVPMINDAIIHILSSKRTEDVLTLEGKEELKEELLDAVNEATGLEEGPIVAIYFNEFIVQ